MYLSVDFEIQFHKICALPTQLGRILHSRNGVKVLARMFNRFGTTQEMMIQTVQENGEDLFWPSTAVACTSPRPSLWVAPVPTITATAGHARGQSSALRPWGLMWRALWQPTSTAFRLKPYLPKRSTRSRPPSEAPRVRRHTDRVSAHSIIAQLAVFYGPVHRPLHNRCRPGRLFCGGWCWFMQAGAGGHAPRAKQQFVRVINLRRVYFFRRLYS